jgi:GT2 family glycosyltransferase
MSAPSSPHVAVVVLTWNGKNDVLHCLSTVDRVRYPNWSLTVVDNASTDGTVEAIAAAHPGQRVLRMEKNLGFCGGNNRGIEDGLARGADYVLLLNNDIEFHPDLLTELVRVAQEDDRIGAVGAKNIQMEDHAVVWGAYGELKYNYSLVTLVGAKQPDGPALTCVRDVDWVIGNGVMMSRAALEKVGGFDENFFGYHEDVDWCERVRHAGFRVVYNGYAIIYHRGFGASHPDSKMPFPVLYFLGRNAVVFVRKHATPWQAVRWATRFGFYMAWHTLWAAVTRDRVKPWLWILRGSVDGVLGRLPLRQLGLQ